jgi:hypothetical protein
VRLQRGSTGGEGPDLRVRRKSGGHTGHYRARSLTYPGGWLKLKFLPPKNSVAPRHEIRMDSGFFTRHRRTFISGGIVLVVMLHLVPLAYPRSRVWPFHFYAMYRNSIPPGPVFTRVRHVFATSASGKIQAITPKNTGLSSFHLDAVYFRPMARGDSSEAAARLLDQLNSRREADPFVEIRLEETKYTVTDSGITKQDAPPMIYRHSPGTSPE